MTIGERIALLRKRAGLSQEKLAALIGVSRQAIGKWESNLSLPGIDNLQELARVLGVSCDELITGVSTTQPDAPNGQVALESVKSLLTQQTETSRRADRRRFLLGLIPALLAFLLALGAVGFSCVLFFRAQGLEDELAALSGRISALQGQLAAGIGTNDPSDSAALVADYSCSYTLLPGGKAVRLQLEALPKSVAAGQSASFSLIAGDQNLVQPATAEGGGFRAEFEIPLTGEYNDFKVSFLLKDTAGNTEQELLFTESEFLTRYTIWLSLDPDTFAAARQSDGSWIIGGRMALSVERSEELYPVAGSLELVIEGKTVQRIPLEAATFDEFADSGDGGADDQAPVATGFISYTDFPIRQYAASGAEEITVVARITDNKGGEHTASWSAA